MQSKCDTRMGAHLTTSRRGYSHHGVYVGHGGVVHYSGSSGFWQCGPVEEVPLSRFAIGHAVRIIDHARPPYSPEEVVRRARSRLGSVLDPDRTVGVSSLAVECTIATGSGRDRPLEQADSRGHRRHRKHGKGAPRPSDAEIGGVVSARFGADGRQSEPHAGAVSAADERIHARHKCYALLRFYKE